MTDSLDRLRTTLADRYTVEQAWGRADPAACVESLRSPDGSGR